MEGQITFHTWIVCFLSLDFGVRARGPEMLKVDGTFPFIDKSPGGWDRRKYYCTKHAWTVLDEI